MIVLFEGDKIEGKSQWFIGPQFRKYAVVLVPFQVTTHSKLGCKGCYYRRKGHDGSQGRNKVLCSRSTALEPPRVILLIFWDPTNVLLSIFLCSQSWRKEMSLTRFRNLGIALYSILSSTTHIHLISACYHFLLPLQPQFILFPSLHVYYDCLGLGCHYGNFLWQTWFLPPHITARVSSL